MTPKPEECEDCGRRRGIVRGECNAYDDPDGSDCLRLGYERRGVEITVLRAQLEDAGRVLTQALLDCARERDEARGALREVQGMLYARGPVAADRGVRLSDIHDKIDATLARAEGVGGKPMKEGT